MEVLTEGMYSAQVTSVRRKAAKRKSGAKEIEEEDEDKEGVKNKKKKLKSKDTKIPQKTLPTSLLAIKNVDKKFHEVWKPGDDLLNLPHPFRGVIMGPPNCGKTTTAKNILLRQQPPFERFYVIHCDGSFTHEYDDVEGKMLSKIPQPEDWPGLSKTLVVIDDLELKTLKPDQRRNLDRLFGYVSTHKNISVLLNAQDPFNVPAIVRRCSNLWILWPGRDVDSIQTCTRKCGEDLRTLFKYCQGPKDSIWIDLTDSSPQKIRLNGYQIPVAIEPEENDIAEN